MLKEHQPSTDVNQQIKNLQELGLVIEDTQKAHQFLNRVSYFRFIKAYSLGLKPKNGKYNEGVTFEQLKNLYIFDTEFRHLLFAEMEKVEIDLRCKIANYFSCTYGIHGYLKSANFKDKSEHAKFLKDIKVEIARNSKAAFVKNFCENYKNENMPFYAIVELFSFGMLSKFFSNLKGKDKNEIAKAYGEKAFYLESWFRHLAHIRNICAHYGRLYNYNLTVTPKIFEQYEKYGIGNLRVFASLVCLKHLLPNDEQWNEFIVKVSLLLSYYPHAKPELMGFPNNWEYILSTPFEKL